MALPFQLVIIQLITFIGLILVLRKLFYGHLTSALGRLKRLQEETLAKEAGLKQELEKARKERETMLAKTKTEADQLIKEAREKSSTMAADAHAAAKQEAQRIAEQAQQDVKKLEHDLQAAYEERAVELAISLLRLTFSEKGRVTLQHQLLLELLDEIAGLPPERFTVKTKSAQIRSAVALLDEERKRVSKILGEKLGVPVALEEAVEPSLIAGLTIQLGALKLDASLEHKLRQGVAYLKSWK